ncbi:hypothetical protein [Bdellovibrio sp. BCCA]|uniref:hypothetical protein n=1 Tax=Bdellovibrio sp. BCCA TaxID=3136281 RepID=UPI0030F04D34
MIKRFFNTPWGKAETQELLSVPDVFVVTAEGGTGVYIPKKYFKFLSENCINNFAYNPDINAEGMWFPESVAQRPMLEIKSHVGQIDPETLGSNLRTILFKDLSFIETSHPLAREINTQISRGNRDVIAAIKDLQNQN